MKDYTITVNGKTYTGKEYPGLMCLKCNRHLCDKEASFEYLGHQIKHIIPVCPECGSMHLSEELCLTKIHEVELLLEEK